MQDYKPNSHRFKAEQQQKAQAASAGERKVQKVVRGPVKVRKKNGLGKVAGALISEDAKNIKEYLIWDMAIPTLKKAALTTLDMLLNGGSVTYTANRSSGSKVSYRNYYDEPRDRRRAEEPRRSNRFDYDELTYASRGEAEAVLFEMEALIDHYDIVSVADLYELSGQPNPPWTANKYGWTSLGGSRIRHIPGEGYIIELPKACPIDR